ncbi:hypothetical protein GOARA_053_00500 [Gordonia araii NBRC 100433]|uniref:DUF3151 domain-containing protein n=1 Tax=Gordonia araii NBRC 100433 TaxID=1073574 RepID=G7H2Z8_9ACTN|nr:DUF3151 domain-containing protein [Gordonia araii]GAB10223.1 hypothetical protein GOARA_053_00500 [Gordonia araii NBRC 100433]
MLGPPPTLLTGDDEAESELLNGVAPATVAAGSPTASIAWAYLAEAALGTVDEKAAAAGEVPPAVIEAYAYARTGYHRGLDQLRRHGWKGYGPVPWEHQQNQGFLRCVGALARAAQLIGEEDEYLRCMDLLNDCDPRAAEHVGLG